MFMRARRAQLLCAHQETPWGIDGRTNDKPMRCWHGSDTPHPRGISYLRYGPVYGLMK